MWQLKLFGGFSLEGEDAISGRASQRKRQALLALLGASPAGQMSRDKLIALLWTESDTERARHQLASSIYDARRLMGDDAILASGDDLRLNPEVVGSDVRAFQAAIEQRNSVRAVELRTGPFLDGFHVTRAPEFERWVDSERDRLDRMFARSLEELAGESNARGDFAGASHWLQRLAATEPYNSRVALLYMHALANSGDTAGALRHGRSHELMLQQELGAPLDPKVAAFMTTLRTTTVPRSESAASTAAEPVRAAEAAPVTDPPRRSVARRRVPAAAAVVILALIGFALYARPERERERSIAVLPFTSMSAGEENSYFADGVHEDVLAQLTKIPDLKVISRTSVMAYRGTQQNLRTIARDLGVAFVLEGSVRRDGSRVRVVAQLIDARTDKHVWGETYERELTDLFAIQSEIARSIAERLHADVPAAREAPAVRPPTTVTEAYDEYLRARSLRYSMAVSEIDYPGTQQKLEHAIRLDPEFTLAYAELTRLHAGQYWVGLDSSPGRAEAAARALESAIRLDPDGAETHLAAAYYYYWVQRDYERALRELARAREQLPGSGEVLHLTGVILRRDGQLDSAIHYLKSAAQLDPARPLPFTYLAESLAAVGRFAEANRAYQLALEKDPDDPYTLRMYGEMYIAWRGETDTLRAAASRMAPGGRVLGGAPAARFRVAMLERNCSAAAAAVQSAPELMGLRDFVRPRALYQAWAAECAGAPGRARSYYREAERLARRMLVQDLPEPAAYLALGQALVGLGRYKEGLEAARKAVSLLPYEHDAFDGGYLITEQAALCVRAGEKEAALDLLERYTGRPFAPWPNELRLDPRWDALRGSPRFQRLVRE